jgi:UDP-N-acetylglucosamine--N-acetylmuramyl-(pentapeptide) pyrophosphoryl-undecaprenol N-acetylglucosamine transferase
MDVQPRQCSVVFAGGGTGGHLFPAIAIADEIRSIRPDVVITFVGTRGRIEERIVPERGYPFVTVWISGLRRALAVENLLFPLKVVVSVAQSYRLLRALKPDAVVGTGGYVCGPVVFAATLMGIPTMLQEQNSYPGITTRLLSHRVNEVHLSFPSSRQYLRRAENIRVTGNPTRAVLATVRREDGAAHFGIDAARKTLLVFGGSLGARSLNDAMIDALPDLCGSDLQVIWQTGEKDHARVQQRVEQLASGGGDVKVLQFIDRMEYAYAVADLAVCRAGATTVAELTRAGIPSILVPYPRAAADHQTENARALVDAGASRMIPDSELRARLASSVIGLLRDTTQLSRMAAHARELGRPDAARELAHAVLRLAKADDGRTEEGV